MEDEAMIQSIAEEIWRSELQAVSKIATMLSESFIVIVEILEKCTGKVVISGLGKSGIIGRKMAATLASTGTPSFFLHAAEALHGDLGMIGPQDVLIAISNSGNSPEIISLARHAKIFASMIIAMTSNPASELAEISDAVLLVPPVKESDHLGLAPSNSTTVLLVMGDIVALTLSRRKGFSSGQFFRSHPGGALGRALGSGVSGSATPDLSI